jgi:hypothetical protein
LEYNFVRFYILNYDIGNNKGVIFIKFQISAFLRSVFLKLSQKLRKYRKIFSIFCNFVITPSFKRLVFTMNQDDSHQGLYRPEFEHDSCGTGFITNINGHKSNKIIDNALTMLENMEHRGACGCDPDSGDGAGILIQLPHEFLMEECSNLEMSLPEPGEYG